jgi:DNA-directed RNA polymerase specialized sigma24 family protein
MAASASANRDRTNATLPIEATSTDPAVGLPAVAALRRLTEQLERVQVQRARRLGWTWQDIAAALGVTKQTVHRKHR